MTEGASSAAQGTGADHSNATARVLVVVPAFNEEAVIADTLRELLASDPSLDVLVVNDGSSDRTVACVESVGVPVATLPFNVGVGGAMRAGFLYAQRGGYDAVVQFDADGQHDAKYIPALVAGLTKTDVVVGGRFQGQSSYKAGLIRRLAMRVLSSAVSAICRTPVNDTTSGFRAAGPRAIDLFAKHYPAEYLGDTVESLVLAHRSGLSIQEIEVEMRPRAGGQPSQSTFKSAAYLLRAVLVLTIAVLRSYPTTAPVLREPEVAS